MTIFHQKIVAETKDSTVSELTLNGEFVCYILEDGFREVKVKGETRIPGGRYEIVRRVEGGFFGSYRERFGHSFVPHLVKVPGFTYILMHLGNWPKNTRGCLLPATSYDVWHDGNYWGVGSADAYHKLYALLDDAFQQGKVFIEIDRERVAFEDEVAETDVSEPEVVGPEIIDPNNDKYFPSDMGGCGPALLMMASLFLSLLLVALNLM